MITENNFMKITKIILGSVLAAAIFSIYFFEDVSSPVQQKIVQTESAGDMVIAQPHWGAKAAALVFADSSDFPPAGVAQRLASLGIASAVVDSSKFLKGYNLKNKKCLDAGYVADSVRMLVKKIPVTSDKPVFILGLGAGALIPFVNAQAAFEKNIKNISIGFSVYLPAGIALCQPFLTEDKQQKKVLVAAPDVKHNWRSVWSDKPPKETAIFIKEKVTHADTYIAAYGNTLDTLLLNEISSNLGLEMNKPPIPIVEMPVSKANETVTIFFSGDGGWRDLDRSVAEKMVASGYPVAGVDVLRYFWERKTPEQVTADLVATMNYYRSKWGAKSFVLAGFSFGADILPVIYNLLPESEKAAVGSIVFLALGNHADFEVRVAGWLGQSTHEMPLVQELQKMPKNKMLCIYGKEEMEKTGSACTSLQNSEAKIIELPGGHHFDYDYAKLTRLILQNF
jgi:type IV secretory pathway VirJ component